MANESTRIGISGNALKIIAAISMLIDHIGVIFMPGVPVFRIIGRIAFPIFAYMIAEGCYYTRNKLRYFLSVFLLGAVCQAVYAIYDGGKLFGILITFSLSIIVIYSMQFAKKIIFSRESGRALQIFSVLLFFAVVFGVYFLNRNFLIDYGFFGCMAPVFACLLKMPRECDVTLVPSQLLEHTLHVLLLGLCLVFLANEMGERQYYALLALPLLLAYSGRRGKLKMKYFFYLFYPLHLLVLEGIAYLL